MFKFVCNCYLSPHPRFRDKVEDLFRVINLDLPSDVTSGGGFKAGVCGGSFPGIGIGIGIILM
jgi:hypothetical protein